MKINNTVKRTLDILDILSKNPKGLTLGEITSQLCIPKTSVFDILSTLRQDNFIEISDSRIKSYVIGVRAFTIGNSYIQHTDILKVSKEILQELGDKLGRTIFIGRQYQSSIVYLYKYEPSNAIITTSNIGTLNDIYSTSLGKAIFAYKDNIDEILDQIDFIPRTKRTITNKSDFLKALEEVRNKGYSEDNREVDENLSCIGAPIYDHEGKVLYAISASGFYNDSMDIDYISTKVKEAATMISTRLGY